jgi:PAS domain S-box-containing protein/putative nucleotidyltransferase with HDIG domain
MVLDFQNRIVDLNPAAQQLIGHTISELIGQPVGQVWPEWSSQMEYDERGKEVVLDKGDGQRTYDVRISSLVDWRGQIISRVVVLRDITERKQAEEELKQSFEKLQRIFEGTVHALASAVEMRDPYTAGHQRRVANLACAIAKEMGLSEEQISGLRMAGLIHDIGKISVPVQILSKRGGLNDLEFDMIKTHPQVGHDILKTIEFPWPVAQIVLQHHERMDGSGYPAGLSGEGILMEARILSVADVVEAMASHRPYRSALGVDKALEEISQNRGVLYDPEVVDACLKLFTEKGFTFE